MLQPLTPTCFSLIIYRCSSLFFLQFFCPQFPRTEQKTRTHLILCSLTAPDLTTVFCSLRCTCKDGLTVGWQMPRRYCKPGLYQLMFAHRKMSRDARSLEPLTDKQECKDRRPDELVWVFTCEIMCVRRHIINRNITFERCCHLCLLHCRWYFFLRAILVESTECEKERSTF